MMPFRLQIQKNLEKIKDYKFDMIAPSHGPVHDKPEFIIKTYRSWAFDEPGNIVVIPYVSMHGITRRMVAYLVEALTRRGVTVKQFDLAVSDIGKLAGALVDAATIVIGTPTVLTGPHPAVAYATILANALKPKAKFASVIGSYGWGGKAVEQIAGMIPNLKVELLSPVYCQGAPKEAEYQALDNLAATIAQKHKENKLA
jgi:flavorubredoxin